MLIALGASGPHVAGEANTIGYVYDDLGRLVGVLDPASGTAVYSYDAVGNLLSISRSAPTALTVIDFTPRQGPVGATVTITGTGFSPAPDQNLVAFNGTLATVASSSATQIVVAVPAGASTGPISLTVGTATASNSASFIVSVPTGVPTIAGFTPTVGTVGTAVTVTGTNFEPAPTNNRLNFNLARSAIGSASATTLVATVPGGATSGHVFVATPAGATQSRNDFFVPPPGFTNADVAFIGRIAIDGGSLTAIVSASKIGLVVFDGTAGQVVSLGMTAVTINETDVVIFRPDGATLLRQYAACCGGRYDMHPGALPTTGTYTILLDPRGTWSGSMTLTLSQDLAPVPIAIGGAPVVLTVTRPAQRTPLVFSGTSGQRLSLGFTANSFNGTETILGPDGTTLTAGPAGSSAPSLDLPPLPLTGTYAIYIDPANAGTGSMTVTLSEEVSGAITIGGAPVPLSLTRPGQRARLTFSGTAGQRVDLGLTSSTIGSATAAILDPGGTTLGSVGFSTTNTALDVALPVTGTYAVLIDPSTTSTGSVTLSLSEEVAGTVMPGGAAVSVSVTRPGQRARLAFSGTAGRRVSVGLTGSTITSSTLSMITPDGTTQASTTTSFLDPQTLATSGAYAVLLDPGQAYTGNATVTAYDVPADVTGSVMINGAALHVALTVPGQQAFIAFPGTSGQAVTVHGASSTIGCLTLYLNDPTSGFSSTTPCSASFSPARTLTQTGTYTIRVDPTGANTGSVDISVTSP